MTLTDPYGAGDLQQQVDTLQQVLKGVYNERARLVAYLAAHNPAHIGYTDATTPEWPVVTVETPAGQMSWHIAAADVGLFDHVPSDGDAPVWDGHSTEEKYARLQLLTALVHDHRQEDAGDAPETPQAPVEPPKAPEAPQDPQQGAQEPQGGSDA